MDNEKNIKNNVLSEKSVRIIVYPATFAFIILAAYGFYLIQSLSVDVNKINKSIMGMVKINNEYIKINKKNLEYQKELLLSIKKIHENKK